jgi:hypothetical protein
MSDFDTALQRLTAWVRDYGDSKPREFIGDLSLVLLAAKENYELRREIDNLRSLENVKTGISWMKSCDELTAECLRHKDEIDCLREANRKLREISLRRFVWAVSSGDLEDGKFVATQWHWSCSLCGAESVSDSDTENLEHKADCPIPWVRTSIAEGAREKA